MRESSARSLTLVGLSHGSRRERASRPSSIRESGSDQPAQLFETAHAGGDGGGVRLLVFFPHAAVRVLPVLHAVQIPDQLLEQVLVGVAAQDAGAFLLERRDLIEEDADRVVLLEAPRIGDLYAADVVARVDVLKAGVRALPEGPVDLPTVPVQDVQQAPVDAPGGRPVAERLVPLSHVDVVANPDPLVIAAGSRKKKSVAQLELR